MGMEKEVLKIEHIHKKFDDLTVLEDVSLTVHEGEIIVIVGPSGCGKSTFLRCLNGLEEISEGHIYIDEEPVNPSGKNITLTPALQYLHMHQAPPYPLSSALVQHP